MIIKIIVPSTIYNMYSITCSDIHDELQFNFNDSVKQNRDDLADVDVTHI